MHSVDYAARDAGSTGLPNRRCLLHGPALAAYSAAGVQSSGGGCVPLAFFAVSSCASSSVDRRRHRRAGLDRSLQPPYCKATVGANP
jgi:hypothetical protein